MTIRDIVKAHKLAGLAYCVSLYDKPPKSACSNKGTRTHIILFNNERAVSFEALNRRGLFKTNKGVVYSS